MDLKLEHSKLLERFESDRYALTTDLLAAKNDVVELEMRLQESEAELAARQKEATMALSEREVMQVFYTKGEGRMVMCEARGAYEWVEELIELLTPFV